ncbi:hypothetical protein BIW11_03175 [Tropilaelaps mercedesae]|uniref:Uncharacterized protein n=1 Tax=Tropilaelaps mercedesae TaxID=418985 RepID=A0A1V9XR29_9ACAR|nr:hypothetical protein BIW11_03175 [Tropilaelaps mercedesae]
MTWMCLYNIKVYPSGKHSKVADRARIVSGEPPIQLNFIDKPCRPAAFKQDVRGQQQRSSHHSEQHYGHYLASYPNMRESAAVSALAFVLVGAVETVLRALPPGENTASCAALFNGYSSALANKRGSSSADVVYEQCLCIRVCSDALFRAVVMIAGEEDFGERLRGGGSGWKWLLWRVAKQTRSYYSTRQFPRCRPRVVSGDVEDNVLLVDRPPAAAATEEIQLSNRSLPCQ